MVSSRWRNRRAAVPGSTTRSARAAAPCASRVRQTRVVVFEGLVACHQKPLRSRGPPVACRRCTDAPLPARRPRHLSILARRPNQSCSRSLRSCASVLVKEPIQAEPLAHLARATTPSTNMVSSASGLPRRASSSAASAFTPGPGRPRPSGPVGRHFLVGQLPARREIRCAGFLRLKAGAFRAGASS